MNKIKMIFAAMACIMLALPVSAQNYRNSRYYNSNSNRLDYGRDDAMRAMPTMAYALARHSQRSTLTMTVLTEATRRQD